MPESFKDIANARLAMLPKYQSPALLVHAGGYRHACFHSADVGDNCADDKRFRIIRVACGDDPHDGARHDAVYYPIVRTDNSTLATQALA